MINKMEIKYEVYEEVNMFTDNGWDSIIIPIITEINKFNEKYKGRCFIEIRQIKEKFGGLRFYIQFDGDDENDIEQKNSSSVIRKLIFNGEEESYKTCEACGTKKNVTTSAKPKNNWIKTFCDSCREKNPIYK